jgi:hypothetical protein
LGGVVVHLSSNFTRAEFEFSDTAVRNGIDNHMPDALIPNAERLCQLVLEPVRRRFGQVRITSGYRCLPLNRMLKSKDTSQHTQGQAADIVIVQGSRPLTVADWIMNEGLPFDQVINEFGRWCHVSVAHDGKEPRRQALTIDKHGTREGLHEARP